MADEYWNFIKFYESTYKLNVHHTVSELKIDFYFSAKERQEIEYRFSLMRCLNDYKMIGCVHCNFPILATEKVIGITNETSQFICDNKDIGHCLNGTMICSGCNRTLIGKKDDKYYYFYPSCLVFYGRRTEQNATTN